MKEIDDVIVQIRYLKLNKEQIINQYEFKPLLKNSFVICSLRDLFIKKTFKTHHSLFLLNKDKNKINYLRYFYYNLYLISCAFLGLLFPLIFMSEFLSSTFYYLSGFFLLSVVSTYIMSRACEKYSFFNKQMKKGYCNNMLEKNKVLVCEEIIVYLENKSISNTNTEEEKDAICYLKKFIIQLKESDNNYYDIIKNDAFERLSYIVTSDKKVNSVILDKRIK